MNLCTLRFSKYLLLTAFFLTAPLIYTQVPDTLWTRTIGGTNIDAGYCIEQTTDGGYIISGYTRSYGTMSGRNFLLIKLTPSGSTEWIKAYGGNGDEEAYSVKQTADKGYILAGYTKSYGAGGTDFFLVKTDSSGNELWNKVYGGTLDDEGFSVLQTDDGGYIIAGVTSSYASGGRDIWIVKTDAAGNLLWNKPLGGLGSDGARSIDKTSDGGYILTGWTFSYGGSLGKAWLVKTDASGNMQWQTSFGTSVDRGYSAQQTRDGGYILTGYTDSYGAGLYDCLLIKTDGSGSQQWLKTFGGTGRDYGNWVRQTSDDGYVLTGYTLSSGAGGDDLWIIKTDTAGTLEWSKTYGGTASDVGNYLTLTSDGGIIVTGHTLSSGAGLHDVWVIKTGAYIPVELVSFSAQIEDNNVILNWSTATETNNKGFQIERRSGTAGSFDVIGYTAGRGTSTELNSYSFRDNNPGTGEFTYRLKQIDFDGSFEYSYEVKVSINTAGQFELYQNYPNPFNPETRIKYSIPESSGSSPTRLSLFDILGNEVAVLVDEQKEPGVYEVEFNAKNIPSGIYFYRLVSGTFNQTRKMSVIK